MITLCTVVLDSCERYLPVLVESIVEKTKYISEVLIAKPDGKKDYSREWIDRNIRFLEFTHSEELFHSHSLCLHECIDRAKNDFVLLCDPDVFFYSAAEEVFLDLYHKHELGAIGTSHHNSINQAQAFFPYIFNLLLRKSTLPDANWMKGLIKTPPVLLLGQKDRYETAKIMDGKWLLPGAIPGYWERFPNHGNNAIFDVSCNLTLWAQDQNWKWLSFQTTDCHTYTTRYFRGNFKIKEKIPFRKLIYHSVGSTNERNEEFLNYIDIYKSSKKEENEV
jgi:hypothetical protein